MMSTETSTPPGPDRRPASLSFVAAGCLWCGIALLLAASMAAGAEQMESAILKVQYRSVQELQAVAAPLLSPAGRMSADVRTNTLVVVDTPAAVSRITGLLQRLDRPPVQLRIGVRFGRSRSETGKAVGVEGSVSGDGWTVSTGPDAPEGIEVELREDARAAAGKDRVWVTTVSGSPAHVSVGTEIPYRERGGTVCRRFGGCPPDVLFHRVETGFWVTPRLSGERIDLEIVPEVADLASGKRVRFASAAAHLSVEPGQWIEIGGGRKNQKEALAEILGVSDAGRRESFSIFLKVDRLDVR